MFAARRREWNWVERSMSARMRGAGLLARLSFAHDGDWAVREHADGGRACDTTYQHLRASMSLPGMSRHLRIRPVWWRTASRASLSRRTWSSGGAGAAMASDRLLILRIDCFFCSRYRPPIHPMAASPYWVGAIVPSLGKAWRDSTAHSGSWS